MSSMSRIDFTLHNALTQWGSGPFAMVTVAILMVLGYFYLQGDWRLASRGRRWPRRRTVAFLAGLVAIDLALQSPVATLAGSYFQAHVVQHLLLMVVAPAFLALGAPSTLFLQTARRKNKSRWLGLLRSRWFEVLSHPVPVWFLYFGLMFVFFLSPLINVAMLHMALMDLINVVFLLGGCLYWWPMIGIDPIVHWKMDYGARMVNAMIGAAPETFLGIAIMSDRSPIASMYTLASTHTGGGMLWASTEIATLGAFLPIFIQWMRSEERAGARADAAQDRAGQVVVRSPEDGGRGTGPEEGALRAPGRTTGPGLDGPLSAWELAWLAKTGSIPYAPAVGGSARPPAADGPRDGLGGRDRLPLALRERTINARNQDLQAEAEVVAVAQDGAPHRPASSPVQDPSGGIARGRR